MNFNAMNWRLFEPISHLVLSSFIVFGYLNVHAGDTPSPSKIFGSLPPLKSIELSPDGSKAVMLIAQGDTYHVALFDLVKSKTKLLMAANPEEFTYNWCKFANDTRIVCSMGSFIELQAGQIGIGRRQYLEGRTVATRLIAVDVDGGNVLQLVKPKTGQSGTGRLVWNPRLQDTVVSWLPDDKRNILIQLAREDRLYPSVYKLNIYNNKISRVKKFRPGIYVWAADHAGKLRNGFGVTPTSLEFRAYSVKGDNASEMDLSGLGGANRRPDFLDYLGSGDLALVFTDAGNDKRGLYSADAITGEIKKAIYTDEDFDADGSVVVINGQLVALKTYGESVKYIWFNEELKTEYEILKSSLPGSPSRIDPVTFSDNLEKIIFRASGNQTVPRYYLYDRSKPNRNIVAMFSDYPKADVNLIAEPEYVTYESRDGIMIPGYLTMPRQAPAKKLPTVILPHGGPYARDNGEFDYWVQYFVAKGYAVLQPNFRGSTGYGDKFMLAGYEEWGEKMQTDLDDGLAWLIERGITDPDRVCMVGGSYGGYASLVAGYKEPEKYKCVVAFAPVTDIDALVRKQRETVGVNSIPVQSGERRSRNSPIEQVADFLSPLLLIHGDVDRVVFPEQSRTFSEALTDAGKSHKYIEQRNGDHYLSLQSNRMEFFTEMDKFLSKHL